MSEKRALVSAFPRSRPTLASLAALAVVSPALAQPSALEIRMFATTVPGWPTSVAVEPLFIATTGNGALVLLPQDVTYLSNGTTLTRVMQSGTQIPGQPPGVVYGERSFVLDPWPLENGRIYFRTRARGPGIGDTDQYRGFFGDPISGLSMHPGESAVEPTRTGFYFRKDTQRNLLGGALGEPESMLIPRTYVPPGYLYRQDNHLAFELRTGPDGSAVFPVTLRPMSSPSVPIILGYVAGQPQIIAFSGASLETDAGSFPLDYASIGAASHLLPDGSLYLSSLTPYGSILWRSEPSGRNVLVAATGRSAPGAEPGTTFTSLNSIGANTRGSMLFLATVQSPSGAQSRALYLYRRGRLTLVFRARPDFSADPWIPNVKGAATINENDQVGLITLSGAVLFDPARGTAIIAHHRQTVPDEIPLTGYIDRISSVFTASGHPGTARRIGGDEASIPCLTADGELQFSIETGLPRTVSFIGVRFTGDPCPADFNFDGMIDFFDYADFVSCFEAGRCPDGRNPDFNHDDFDDFFDYTDFVTAFETGC